VPRAKIFPERYCFSQPLSPHLAARIDSQSIKIDDFVLPDLAQVKHLVVEGAGGLLVPLNEHDKVIDLIQSFALPVVLVARTALGTINHTLLSLEALRQRKIEILGVVMTGEPNLENRLAIERFGAVDVLAEIPVLPDFKTETLARCFVECFVKGERRNADSCTENLASVYTDANSRAGA
jgi:dethiobiotin synthetase